MQVKAAKRAPDSLDVEHLEAVLASPGWTLIAAEIQALLASAIRDCVTAKDRETHVHAPGRHAAYLAVGRIPDTIKRKAAEASSQPEEKPST